MATGAGTGAPATKDATPEEIEAFTALASANGGNMFINQSHRLSALAILETAICGVVLMPIRLVLLVIILVTVSTLAWFGTIGLRRDDLQKPLATWRTALMWPIHPLLRLAMFVASIHWVSVKGKLVHKQAAPICVSNHLSFVEPIVLLGLLGGSPVAAIENAQIPFLGSVFIALQTVFVDRRSGSKAGGSASGSGEAGEGTSSAGAPTAAAAPAPATISIAAPTAAAVTAPAVAASAPTQNHDGVGSGNHAAAADEDSDADAAAAAPLLGVSQQAQSAAPDAASAAAAAGGAASGSSADAAARFSTAVSGGAAAMTQAAGAAAATAQQAFTGIASSLGALAASATASTNPVTGSATADKVRETIRERAMDPAFPRVIIFPEGTCTNGTAVISFKTGAFSPGLPVQPVVVRYPWAKTHFDPSFVDGGPQLYSLIMRLLTRFHTPMEVTILPPYTPTAAERADPRLYASNVQTLMARELGVRTTQHSFEDLMLASVAAKAHYPVDHALVEFQALRSVLDIDAKTAQAYLKRFIAADPHKTGRLTYDQFKTLLLAQERPPVGAAAPAAASSGAGAATSIAVAAPAASAPAVGKPAADAGVDGDAETVCGVRSRASSAADGASSGGKREGEEAEEAVVSSASAGDLGLDRELRKLFDLLDYNESGTLDFRELLVGLSILNQHSKAGARSSSSGSSAVPASGGSSTLPAPADDELLLLAFRLLGSTTTGRLTKEQLQSALRQVWPDMSAAALEEAFNAADANKDGSISPMEFVAFAKTHPELQHLFGKQTVSFSEELSSLAEREAAFRAATLGGGSGGASDTGKDASSKRD